MQKILFKILKFLARVTLKRYKPDIVGITGSVGKSSTREAVFTVLKTQFNARQSQKNYNNEIGLPITVLGCKPHGKSILGWLGVIIKSVFLIIFKSKKYPQILILEMAADKPGDISYLLKIIPQNLLKAGIVTAVSPTHLETFKTVENVLAEKKRLLLGVRHNGWAIANRDSVYFDELKKDVKSKIMSYGLEQRSDVTAKEVKITEDKGITFKLATISSVVPAALTDALGAHQLYAALAAASIGVAFGVTLVHISEALKEYHALPGRMRLLDGIKHTKIIDDTYNSSPLAALAAVQTLVRLKSEGVKWAVMGDMLELGRESEAEHRSLGREIFRAGIDYLVVVGELSRDIARGARKIGMNKDHIFEFADANTAGRFIQDRLKKNDLLLIKGSQGVRMEKITKELMAEPLRAEELLVRHDREWLKK